VTSEIGRCAICGEEHALATMVTGHKQPEDLPDAPARQPAPSDWWLQDGEALHAEHPRSFFIPPAERRRALRPGDLVRLGFAFGPHADRDGEGHVERMWVQVLECEDGRRARGRLRNSPVRLAELRLGDVVAFESQHVLSIDLTDEELGYEQNDWPVVDAAVIRDDRPPDIVVRAPGPYAADHETWWMVCREGTAGPTIASPRDLTDRFPELAEPLRARDGLWELAGGELARARWRRVTDDEIAGSEDWQEFLAWLERTAQAMRASTTD
jgi:hypothetical protein